MSAVAPDPTEKQPSKPQSSRSSNSKTARNRQNSGGTAEDTSSAGGDNHANEKSVDDALLQSIASKSSCMMQPTITITMYIRTSSVGAVIGRRGQNIANLQKLASQAATTNQPVRVSVIGQDSSTESLPYTYSELDFSDPNWTPVVIRADPKAAFTAAEKLEETVSGAVDEVVLDIPMSRNKHATIVGKRGLTLANMSADTNVRIMVPNKDLRHDVIQLEGDLANVKQCLDRVLQVAAKARNAKSTGSGGGDEPSYSQTITVPQLPSQTKLRSVGRKTDSVVKKRKDGDSWQLTVSSTTSQESVQSAIALLQKWSDDATAALNADPTSPDARSGSPSQQAKRQNNRGGKGHRGRRKRGEKKGSGSGAGNGDGTAST